MTYNSLFKHMTILSESQPGRGPQPPALGKEIELSRPEIAKTLAFAQKKYDFQQYLSPDVETGLNLSTALAAMHAIDAKGQQSGWKYEDLLAALPVTRVALTTAGFAHAESGLHALLTGTTGELGDIVGKILPQDAPKGIKGMAQMMLWVNTADNMRVVAGLLIDEKQIERRLLRLTKLQQNLLSDPGKTRALLDVLNGEYTPPKTLGRTGLPKEAEKHLQKVSPFSLEDMIHISNLFTSVEWRRNSAIQVETQRLWIETELKRLEAAGINIAKLFTLGTESVVKNTLLIAGGTVGGVVGGVILGGERGAGIVGDAINTAKEHWDERKAVKAGTT